MLKTIILNVIIYANASYNIGTGHVMRSLALADFLSEKGCQISFMTDSTLPGNMASLIVSRGYQTIEPSIENIPERTDLLIIDNYNIDEKFESIARMRTKSIMVIDDLANRKHDCDILLDQNYDNKAERYKNLVPSHCQLLLGSKYVMLRDEFLKEKVNVRKRDGSIKRILVNFGGSDPVDMTSRVLDILKTYDVKVDVVMGKSALYLAKVSKICDQNKNFTLHVNTSQMAKLIVNADLAIAAGGTSIWERSFLELPSIIIAIADNQLEISKSFAAKDLLFYAGYYSDHNIDQKIAELLSSCINNPTMVKNQSEKLMSLLDGRGKERIWEAYLQRKI